MPATVLSILSTSILNSHNDSHFIGEDTKDQTG